MSQQRMGFGPWSSALDSGTRLELSAFWRRRMAGLARLPLGRQVSGRWTAVGAVAALLVAATPLVEFVSTPVAAEEAEADSIPPGTPDLASRFEPPTAEEWRAIDALETKKRELVQDLVDAGIFTLSPGELVRFVPATTSGEPRRQYAKLASEGRRITAFLQFKDGGAEATGWIYGDMNLESAIRAVLGVPLQQVRAGDETLRLAMPEGDWICSWDTRQRPPVNAELVAAFEKTMRSELKLPLRFALEQKQLPVLIASGDYQANPIADEAGKIAPLSPEVADKADGPFLFPASRGPIVQMVGDFPGMLNAVGAMLLTPILDEASRGPTKEAFFMAFAESPRVEFREPLEEGAARSVVEAFEKQTGLTLTPGERDVEMLVISNEGSEKE